MARTRGNRVCSMEKRNVMKSGVLWNQVVTETHKAKYSDVQLEHMLADAGGMQLVRQPKQFDVIVTDNLFGDMLSDVAAMLTGSLGMLPSASLGAPDAKTGKREALYEPVHGSAPDIAGKGVANPIAMIASFAMCLRYSFNLVTEADNLEKAIANVLDKGIRTADIMAEGPKRLAPSKWATLSFPSSRRFLPDISRETGFRPSASRDAEGLCIEATGCHAYVHFCTRLKPAECHDRDRRSQD